jgi:hypothetical protein
LPGKIWGVFSGAAGRILSGMTKIIDGVISKIGGAIKKLGELAKKAKKSGGSLIEKIPIAGSAYKGAKSLLGLSAGGKVGPGYGGAQMFVAGEGGKDEWVISQEGDRKKNIGYAMEALGALGANGYKLGGKIGRNKNKVAQMDASREDAERNYSIAQRGFELSDGLSQGEYDRLGVLRAKITDSKGAEKRLIDSTMKPISNEQKRLKKLIAKARGNKKTKLKASLEEVNALQAEFREKSKALTFEIKEGALDLTDLGNQAAAAAKETATAAPDTSGPSLAEQFSSFNSSRFDLIKSFGGNTGAVPMSAAASSVGGAAGGKSGAPTIVNNYTTAPADPAAWNKSMELQLRAAS